MSTTASRPASRPACSGAAEHHHPNSSSNHTQKKQPPAEEEPRSLSRSRSRSRSSSSKKRKPIAGLQAPSSGDSALGDEDDDRAEQGGPIDLDAFVGKTSNDDDDDDDILNLLEAGQANTVVATATKTRQQRRKQHQLEQPPAASPKQQQQQAATATAAVLADGFSSPADDDETTTASMVTATAGNTTTTAVMMTRSSSSKVTAANTMTPTTTMTKEETASSENDDNHDKDNDDDPDDDDDDDEGIAIPDDVYTLFFVSAVPGLACFYSVYVFALKMTLYTFLAVDTFDFDLYFGAAPTASSRIVLAAQFLMIPVAVALQADLIDSFYLMANAQYDDSIKSSNRHMRSLPPHATRGKYAASVAARFADGVYSLLVNFVVLLTAETVLALFLNFAALHFLQIIDNTALEMAAKGYLTDQLERDAAAARRARLPRRPARQACRRACDSVLFAATVAILSAAWGTLYYLHRRDGDSSDTAVEEL